MHTTIIRANTAWWRINLREIWEYRDLIGIMARRDLISTYKQSVLGPTWFVIQPLLTTIVFTVVFGKIASIGTDGVPPLLFYMSGMLTWNFFALCMNSIAGTLTGNAPLFRKVYFPRFCIPIVKVLVNGATVALNFLMFLGFWLYYRHGMGSALPPLWQMTALLPIMLFCATLGMGMGLLLASMTIKYHDVKFFQPFLSQLWMYATPIIYPASQVPDQWRWILSYNPMCWAVEATRRTLVGRGSFDGAQAAVSLGIALLLLIGGLFAFNRAQRTFVDIA
jgi:lipopolysaccharide transport system permease protein